MIKSIFLDKAAIGALWVGVIATSAIGADLGAEIPWHDQIIESLKSSDSVLPEMPDIYPVRTVYNREGVVPPQCYTKTQGFYNPCYVCHQDGLVDRENLMDDADLQIDYSFSDLGQTNHWKNLFEDRSERVAKISDKEILDYIEADNYSELAGRLKEAGFEGWIPDMENLHLGAEAFDSEGFAKDGSHWVAFSYKPFPSTFWPTNGSTDDVMIRLPELYRNKKSGEYSRDVYKANLAILEARIKGLDMIGSLPFDEREVGKDLDGDGVLNIAMRVVVVDAFVGAAESEFNETHLYPERTEFMHSVRYLGISEAGEVGVSKRMKELRYLKKWKGYSKPFYARKYELESFEKEAGNLPGYTNLYEKGLDNGTGWSVQGFIEGHDGRLRANTYEENFFCMGCHNSIGSTIDKTFSFPRKVDGAAGWSYIDLKGMPDAPTRGEEIGEIATYLKRVGGGSEFRNNDEMSERWFREDGSLDDEKVSQAKDVYDLIAPSVERALVLNKAYKTIVEDQDFIFGRDATVTPPENVYQRVDNEEAPALPDERVFKWDILLDWSRPEGVKAESSSLVQK